MANCLHPLEKIKRFNAAGHEVEASGLVCTECGVILTAHFFPKDPTFVIAPVHGDPEWRSKGGFGWTDPKAEALSETTLSWDGPLVKLLPPKAEWTER